MGFSSALNAATQAFTGFTQYQERKALKRAANAQETLANRQAENAIQTAARNDIYAHRNANAQMAAARADAAASNLADDGSTRVRELDLATRLEDEITNNTNAALQQAEANRQQGLLNAWNTRNYAKQAGFNAFGSALGAAGSVIGAFIPANRKSGK